MIFSPYWQLLGWILFIAVFAMVAYCIHRSSRYAEEDMSPSPDTYHVFKSDHGKEDEHADS